MHLNSLAGAPGSRKAKKRVGRGIGSGFGKTCGRGHKGQKSRSGGSIKPGFEGGQQPLQRRVPKYGFTSRKAKFRAEIRLDSLNRIEAEKIDIEALKQAGLISGAIKTAKVICSGELKKPVVISGLGVTKNARLAIESIGGKIEE